MSKIREHVCGHEVIIIEKEIALDGGSENRLVLRVYQNGATDFLNIDLMDILEVVKQDFPDL